jgi:hypothetical protein
MKWELTQLFFYQPGIPSRVNPLTPKENQIITAQIGKFHEKRLSEIGSLFYSEEDYDDFYYGKGIASFYEEESPDTTE